VVKKTTGAFAVFGCAVQVMTAGEAIVIVTVTGGGGTLGPEDVATPAARSVFAFMVKG
jgi:hypothetical protein